MKARVLTKQEMKNKFGNEWMQTLDKSFTGWMLEMNKFLGKTIEVELDEYSQTDEWFGAGWYWRVDWLVFTDEDK